MGEGPSVHAEVLLDAGRRYGDAKLAAERNQHKPGTAESNAVVAVLREAEGDLHSAARAYATRMRRKVNKAPPPTAGEPGAGTADGVGMEG